VKTKNDVGRLLLADCLSRTVLIEALTHAGGFPTLRRKTEGVLLVGSRLHTTVTTGY